MDVVSVGPRDAALLAERARRLSESARELSGFVEGDPGLAASCGIETPALEAKLILAGGACARLSGACERAAGMGRSAEVRMGDISALSRLETVISLGSSRIGQHLASLDQEGDFSSQLGSIIGIATGVVGFVKSVF